MINQRIGRRTSGLQSFSCRLLASAAVVALVLGQAAYANPVGGMVSSGKATISTPASGTLQIDQTTKIIIINWNSFNIAGGETTKFVQPNASSIAVNRIGGNDPSTILGSLLANGKVVLINGNGILFGPGSKINVGSLLATTSDASDTDIASGKAKFDKAGNPNAQIINQGNITAASGGMVGLIAPAVSNSGTITAKLGSVTLGASNVFTVDFTGDGLVSFPVDGNVVAAAIGKNGKPVEALVVNDGKISGGTVVLSARAAANLVTNVISMKGEIAATSAHDAGGKIVLDGGQSGNIAVAGSLDASGTSGGNISVVSQGTTSISGTITAKNTTGKGGKIETSGHNLMVAGTVNAGSGGSWLLDPYDLTVDAPAASTINASLGAGTGVTLTTAAGSASGPGTQNASGHGDIIINSAISWSTAAAFTLSAYRNIDINANITASGHGALSLTTGTGTTGDYSIASGTSISFTGGSGSGASLSINGNAYTLLYSMSDVQAINASSAALQGHYALANSLDAASTSGWTPIGTDALGDLYNSGNGFTGVFAGLGHTISNLTVNVHSHNYAGLFGYSGGTIRDIGIIGGSISGADDVGGLIGYNGGAIISDDYATSAVSGSSNVGGLVGYNGGTGTISDSYATGAVSGGSYVGGLVGYNVGAIISDVYATGAVNGGSGSYIGGLVGYNNGTGTISDDHATGAVNGGSYVGGLVGYNNGTGTISDDYATGPVVGNSGPYVGGLVGYNVGAIISDSFATGAVSGSGVVGGLVGKNGGAVISDSYATGAVSGTNFVGGLVGDNGGAVISGSYATGAVSGSSYDVGGLAGWNGGTITQSHATGLVRGSGSVGGLVGRNNGAISGSYATGLVNSSSGSNNVGGLVGYNDGTSMISDDYATGDVYGSKYVGGLVGYNNGTGTISNVYATGAVDGNSGPYVGGLVGYNIGAIISGSHATGVVSGSSNVGGLVGYNSGTGTISYAYATGAVRGNRSVGGLVGYNNGTGTISDVYATGAVNGYSNYIGGLVGYNVGAIISDSFATGAVSVGSNVGGLVGYNGGAVIGGSYATGTVNSGSGSNVGGLVGYNSSTGTISYAYATGAVSGGSDVGGLAGYNSGTGAISYAYATGAVNGGSGSYYVGGLVGENDSGGAINSAYATGAVSGGIGSTYVGGLVGINGGTITQSYWDTESSGLSNAVGGGTTSNAFGLTSTQARTQSSYTGWDFTGTGTWFMIDGETRPFLRSEYSTTITNAHQLQLMAMDLSATYTLAGDIDLNAALVVNANGYYSGMWGSSGFVPVGNGLSQFTGTFDGKNHTISNLKINRPTTSYVGLFGYSSGTIQNVGMISGTVSGQNIVGDLVGYNTGTISNSHATGSVNGDTDIGGLVGNNISGGTITNAYATGEVRGQVYVGGLTGENDATISDAYATGAVHGEDYIGGLAGANTINGTISNAHAIGAVDGNDPVGGLVGYNTGTITNAYATGSTVGREQVGGLVGLNGVAGATISNAYATGSVTGTDGHAGGLAGQNDGVIADSYATGLLAGTSVSVCVGGLVGRNNHTISNAYATGAVNGGTAVGGLVGYNSAAGTVSYAYATGVVDGITNVGGLAGQNVGGAFTNDYWDTETSGRSAGFGTDNNNQSGNVTGKTTAQLQGTLPSGFDSTVWGTGSDLFPYFKWQYSTTPQVISGVAYSDVYVTPLASALVSALVDGTKRGSATTGANGYYYLLVPHGTFSGSQQLLTYLNNGTTLKANTYVQSPTGNVTNANLYVGYLRLISSAGTTSAMLSGLSTAVGAYTGSNFLYSGGSLVSGRSLDIESYRSAGLTIDNALDLGTGTLILKAVGTVAESGAGKITAGTLTGSTHGATTLNAANVITFLGAFTTGGNNAFALTDSSDLTVNGAANAGTAALTLKTNGTGHGILVNGALTGGVVTLNAAATIGGGGKITAATFAGLSHGAVTLNGANAINHLGAFSTSGNNAFWLSNSRDLTVTGAVNAGVATLSLQTNGTGNDIFVNNTLQGSTVKLISAATILSNTSGKITAITLTGSSNGAVTLNAANIISNLGAFTTNNGNLALTDAHALTTNGAVNSGTHTITLTTTGATSNGIAIKSHLTTTGSAGVVTLNSAGNVTETTAGAIITHKLNVTAKTGISLTSPSNNITVLGTHTTVSGPNNINL